MQCFLGLGGGGGVAYSASSDVLKAVILAYNGHIGSVSIELLIMQSFWH